MLKYVFKVLIFFIFSAEGTEAQASEINRSFISQVMQRKGGTYVSWQMKYRCQEVSSISFF